MHRTMLFLRFEEGHQNVSKSPTSEDTWCCTNNLNTTKRIHRNREINSATHLYLFFIKKKRNVIALKKQIYL